ncbi:P-loop containing nucleoside triphosphate hydrolase protein [Crepidotus variabilis]|uniref:P-loop containing nucleoside triphosphate hydrolase protein n=1 Tax=Crepidotus variabilis TaxID=179855 RepID=A0A9P6JKR9_9AGAR|nr:P-loop containing nucleoside triphosphate hydrolase protein [Crepidotus variabilis]
MLVQIPSDSRKTSKLDSNEKVYTYEERQFGIWKLFMAKEASISFIQEAGETLPLLTKLLAGIHSAMPDLFLMFMFCQLWDSIHHVVEIYLSSLLLRQIEAVIVSRDARGSGIIFALVARCLFVAVSSCVQWWIANITPIQESKIRTYLHLEMMQKNLEMDMPTSQAAGQQNVSASELWRAIKHILMFFVDVISVISQTMLLFSLSKDAGGVVFAGLSLVRPLLSAISRQGFFRKGFLIHMNNEDFGRMKSLEKFSNGTFRQDVISYGLAEWILKQYIKAFNSLGNTPIADAWEQMGSKTNPVRQVLEDTLGELPMIYCSLNLILDPTSFSLASIAILHQSASRLKGSVTKLFYTVTRLRTGLSTVRRINDSKIDNLVKDGNAAYSPSPKGSMLGKTGMEFDLRDVCFSYPGAEKVTPALSNVSLHIKPGSVVVIVGENGGGKSTLIRILSRIYDPNSGDVLIDGRPSKEYQISDLHRSSAILSQDNLIYPLSLSENIGLGYPDAHLDAAMIEKSAQEGGAADLIGKLAKGFDTYVEPYINVYHHNLPGGGQHPLAKMAVELRKTPDLSGGEKQRIVAARTFMRFKSGNVNFVAVDEPSAALDAEGEYQLFQSLLSNREGKTMVFVTHRFGHLTKVADQIICMKEGAVVESGNHPELMGMDGEYAKLYNIQAKAFQ